VMIILTLLWCGVGVSLCATEPIFFVIIKKITSYQLYDSISLSRYYYFFDDFCLFGNRLVLGFSLLLYL